MHMDAIKKKKISDFLWPIIYFALVITICFSGCLVFRRYYYCSVFVSGQSMSPTLKGGKGNGDSGVAHFGLVDTTDLAKKRTKRFDIVTTYYPWDDSDYPNGYKPNEKNSLGENAERKIKRVLALPGETITVKNGDITIYKNAYEVTDFEFNTHYKLGAMSTSNQYHHNYYFSNFSGGNLSVTFNFSNFTTYTGDNDDSAVKTEHKGATDVFVAKTSTENQYHLLYEAEPDVFKYINVETNDNSQNLVGGMTASTSWEFNKAFNTLSTKIMNHTDSSKDGEFILTLTLDEENESASKITLSKVDSIDLSKTSIVRLMNRDNESAVRFFPKGGETGNTSNTLVTRKADWTSTSYQLPFSRNFDNRLGNYKDFDEVVLKADNYWVQGDHWGNSTDCYNNGPIYYGNLEGVLVVIEGTCTIGRDKEGHKVCTNHQYGKPIFF